MAVQAAKRWFNVSEYYRMAEAGILTENDRVELVEGEIIKMAPIGSRHAACVRHLDTLLHHQVGAAITVSVQNPVRVDDYSEPEPDIALLRSRDDFYAEKHPTPADVLLIMEIAETSVDYDRGVKLPLYVRAGIPEFWLINLSEENIEIYTRPIDGVYQKLRQAMRGGVLVSHVVPGLTLGVDAVLGKRGS